MFKRWFFVSGAILMLTIAYQFGVTNAHGQSGETVADVHDTGLGSYVVTPQGSVYFSFYGTYDAPSPTWSFRGTISSASPIVHIGDAVSSGGGVIVHAFAENGDFFVSTDDGRSWSTHGNVFSIGPTPILNQSWGGLKARFRSTH